LLRASFCLFQPLVGSEIYRELVRKNKLDTSQERRVLSDYSKASITTEFISDVSLIKKLQRKAILGFYLRPKIFFRLLLENLTLSQIKELARIIKQYVLSR
jgi:hypothetical protein